MEYNKQRSTRFEARMSQEEKMFLEENANRCGVTSSDYVRMLVKMYRLYRWQFPVEVVRSRLPR